MAEALLARGATLTAPIAVALGKADWLIARHANGTLTHPAEGDGLLTVAVEHDRGDMLRLLLDLGFDPDERKRVVSEDGVDESRGIPLERTPVGDRYVLEKMQDNGWILGGLSGTHSLSGPPNPNIPAGYDHQVSGECRRPGPTPTTHHTWGAIKALYR